MRFVRVVALGAVLFGCGREGGKEDGGGEPGFQVALSAATVEVVQGATATVGVSLTRTGGFEEAVTIGVSGLPASVSADPLVIPAGADAGVLTLRADAAAVQGGPTSLTVSGSFEELTGTASLALVVRGIDGTFDLTFGDGDGWTLVDFQNENDEPSALALQADGKVLVGGFATGVNGVTTTWAMTRHLPDGTLDSTFGSGTGKSTLEWGNTARINALAVQDDGRIIAFGHEGWSDQNFGLARFTSEGTLDISFAAGEGKTALDVLDYDNGTALGLHPSGAIYVAGGAASPSYYFALARYDAAGLLDADFGEYDTGRAWHSLTSGNDLAEEMKVFDDGSVLLGGTCSARLCLAKIDADGKLDTTFGENGTGTIVLDGGTATEELRAMAVMDDGRIVVAGYSWSGSTKDMLVARFSADGKVDPTFNGGLGKRTIDVAGGADEAHALLVLADGSLVVGGFTELNGDEDFALARVDEQGLVDLSFGTTGTGTVVNEIGTGDERIHSILLDATGRILVSGWIENGDDKDFALARYWP